MLFRSERKEKDTAIHIHPWDMLRPYMEVLLIRRAPTPFRMVSLLSLHFMNRTTFQLVLQFTEFTWREEEEDV